MSVVRVVRLDTPMEAHTFDSRVGTAPGVDLKVFSLEAPEAMTWAAFAQSHIYHIASARDDLPLKWYANTSLLTQCPQLLAVSTYGAGCDTVDVAACTEAGVCVMNQAGSNAAAVAEHTLGLMLGLSKRIAESDRRLRRGERFARSEAMGTDLEGAVLGLVGLGHAGTRVARIARALGMRVLACDPYLSQQEVERRGAEPVTLQALLAAADVVSLHCPLAADTRGMIGRAEFGAMKPGAIFITTARGGIHDEEALYDALVEGRLAGAGLDVWSVEPPQAQHPLLTLDQVIATAHTAGVTTGSRRAMALMASDQIIALAAGTPPPRLVNPEVLPRFKRRFEDILDRRFSA
jgi:D-3-phosphoglycerate dehydrogenase / 2-oxoglutarate reductase